MSGSHLNKQANDREKLFDWKYWQKKIKGTIEQNDF